MAEGSGEAGTDDPFKSLLGEISEDQWEAYKALRKQVSTLLFIF